MQVSKEEEEEKGDSGSKQGNVQLTESEVLKLHKKVKN